MVLRIPTGFQILLRVSIDSRSFLRVPRASKDFLLELVPKIATVINPHCELKNICFSEEAGRLLNLWCGLKAGLEAFDWKTDFLTLFSRSE